MKVTGYADELSVEPGGALTFRISSEARRYRAELVRLIHGDTNPRGPGFKSEPLPSDIGGEHEGRVQRIYPGSYVRVPDDGQGGLDASASLAVEAWIFPTTPAKDRQALISRRGAFEFALAEGRPELRVGDLVVRLEERIEHPAWFFVSATYDGDAKRAQIRLLSSDGTELGSASAALASPGATLAAEVGADLLIAAAEGADGPTHFYNGKIEAPRITAGGELLASWDFAADISSRRVRDVSGSGLDGRAVNMPTRGVTGHDWDGTETAWRHAPRQYGAIHFHDDDLDDAGWEPDLTLTVPPETPSGVYAVRLEADGEDDHIPFFVRPKTGRPTARILFLAPLFSYLAYADEQVVAATIGASPQAREKWIERFEARFPGVELGAALRDYPSSPEDRYIVDNRLLSLYDRHSDGSGVCYSSWRRPLVNMRPSYAASWLSLGAGAPHQFGSDLFLVDWLHEQGYAFDVVTDVDLHREGAPLLEGYSVVLSGSHAEYWSSEMLDAMGAYLTGGGRLMSLCGNGYYWVTQLDPEEEHTVEIRRGAPASGTWRCEPGEANLSTTGELGGIWRGRGRAPQRLVGAGFTSQGEGPGRPYRREPGSHDPRVAFVFDGVGEDELIGDFPCLVNEHGAAGFELDRLDHALGTPHEAILLASASGFSDQYKLCVEDIMDSDTPLGGSVNPLVRADMVYLEYPRGGAVFSTGSIAWCGCLSHDGYDNNVSRITKNVLDRFAS